jgi:ABC-type dipeptide/oligopeptide/nickel transport system ATPase component
MERLTFSTFVVKDENRRAADLCLAVANLQPVKPLPLSIIGESGSGKTHLLCAIVNHIEKHSARTALAYVTARDFPLAVRSLARDAGPVTRAQSAVLLVDQLEKFPPDMLSLLARIAPLFLDEGRCLVVASQIRPEEMPGLPAPLLGLLEAGQTAAITRGAITRVTIRPAAAPAQVVQLRSENESLRHELEQARAEAARMRERVAFAESDLEHLERDRDLLDKAISEQRVLEEEVRSLQRELVETRKQRDAWQTDSSALAAATAELARLREVASDPARPDRAAEEQIQQAQQAAKDAQAELGRWTLKAQAILQQVELNRARFAENTELELQHVLALRERVEEMAQADLGDPTPSAAEADPAADIARQLVDIAEAAAQFPTGDATTRIQTLYAQLLEATQAIQELSDRVGVRGNQSGATMSRPWYVEPFPLPPSGFIQGPET